MPTTVTNKQLRIINRNLIIINRVVLRIERMDLVNFYKKHRTLRISRKTVVLFIPKGNKNHEENH